LRAEPGRRGRARRSCAAGATPLEAAAIDAAAISDELGGLAPTHRHSADLAADALHRALSALAGSGLPLAPPPPRASGSWSP
jgi:tRNA-specific 2-thiouridylase